MVGGYGTHTSRGWDMGVPTHWCGAGNGGTVGDRGINLPLPEYGRTLNCDSSYHRHVSDSGTEARYVTIQEMVGASTPGCPGDKGMSCSRGWEVGYGDKRTGGTGRVEEGIMKGRERYDRRTRDVLTEV